MIDKCATLTELEYHQVKIEYMNIYFAQTNANANANENSHIEKALNFANEQLHGKKEKQEITKD